MNKQSIDFKQYYYKYKALKYYLKNNSIDIQKQMKGVSIHRNIDLVKNTYLIDIMKKQEHYLKDAKYIITELFT